MQRTVRITIALALFVISIWYISRVFSWADIRQSFARLDWWLFLSGATALLILNILARALRWWVLIRERHRPVSLRALYMPTMIFVSLSMMTPGQLGEIMKIEVFKRQSGLERLPGLGAFFVERLLDFGLVLLMAGFGLLLLLPKDQGSPMAVLALVLIALVAILLVALRYLRLPGRAGALLERVGEAVRSGSGIPLAACFTVLSWSFVIAAWHFTFHLLDVHIPLHQTIAITGLVTLSVIVSFIPGGLGISELVTTELLMLCGVEAEGAQASALAIRLLGIWWIVVGLLHLAWWSVRHRPSERRAA